MEYRQLGRSGLRVSKLCLGTMFGFTEEGRENATRVVDEALELGVNFIDSADCYPGSEETLGRILSEGNRRDKVVLTTKFGWYMGEGPNDYGGSRQHIMRACEESLRKLRTDWIDHYVMHVVDPNTALDEVLRALDDLVRQGKVRYIGTSKHPASRIVESLWLSDKYGLERFISEQPPYNLLDRGAENELIPTCVRHGIGITPYVPLSTGLLSGKYRLGQENPAGGRLSNRKPDQDEIFTTAALEAVGKLQALADAKGITLAQFSLAWLMQRPGLIAPICGAHTPEYVRSAVEACEVEFMPEELAKVDEIVPPGGYVSNHYTANFYRPMRVLYSAEARKQKAGAFIPDTKTGSGKDAGHNA